MSSLTLKMSIMRIKALLWVARSAEPFVDELNLVISGVGYCSVDVVAFDWIFFVIVEWNTASSPGSPYLRPLNVLGNQHVVVFDLLNVSFGLRTPDFSNSLSLVALVAGHVCRHEGVLPLH